MKVETIDKVQSIRRNTPCVYFISDGQGHCKVGIASDFYNRFNTIQVGSAFDLQLKKIIYTDTIGEANDLERYYHGLLSSKRIRGEWFDETAVDDVLSGKRIESNYDFPIGFNLNDLIDLFMLSHFADNEEKFLEGYEKCIADWIKEEDKRRGKAPVEHWKNSRARKIGRSA